MSNYNAISTRIFAAFGAVAMTATLLASYFATPTATAYMGVMA